MRSKKFIWHIILITLPFIGWAQDHGKKVFDKPFKLGHYAPIYFSYYGNLATHPGFKSGIDWNLLLIEKTKKSKKKIKTIRKSILVSPGIAYYIHPASHKGLLISTDLGYRRYSKRLFYQEIDIGIGYLRKFNSGDTWEVDDNGNINDIGGTSRGYFTPSISVAFGKVLARKDANPVLVYLKLNTNFLTSYNATTIPDLSLELGARININKGLKRGNVKTIQKQKPKPKSRPKEENT